MIPIVAGLLMGAAVGGGIAALQKKDVLQGALMGGIGGALGGAFMPAAGASVGTAVGEGVGAVANPLAGDVAGIMAQSGAPVTAGTGVVNPLASDVAGIMTQAGAPAASVAPGIASIPTTSTSDLFSGGFGDFLSKNKYALAGGTIGGMLAPGQEPKKPDEGNIQTFGFNREINPAFGQPGQPYFKDNYIYKGSQKASDYEPTQFAADGGIIALADGGRPQDYRVAELAPVQTNTYAPNIRSVAPEVAAYNQQMMQRANQQYNLNPRPAALQIPTAALAPTMPGVVDPGYVTPMPSAPSAGGAGIGGLRFDPVAGRYIGSFEAPNSKKSDLEKMREELDALKTEKAQYYDGSGGAAAGGLMRSYAMGGDIGARYSSPDDGGVQDRSNIIGASNIVNMAPHYPMQGLYQGYAGGGQLGGYSDGGQLLKGPGDGVSDDIPAQIGDRQPARLADGEFVVPARIVSELGNGSTDAGAKRLYAMMDRVQKARKKSVGKDNVAVDSKASRHLPV